MNISSISHAAGAPGSSAAESLPARTVTEEQRTLIQAVKAVNASEMLDDDNELTFALDRGSRQPVVRIVNQKTGQVIRQIPSEDVLRMAEEIKRG